MLDSCSSWLRPGRAGCQRAPSIVRCSTQTLIGSAGSGLPVITAPASGCGSIESVTICLPRDELLPRGGRDGCAQLGEVDFADGRSGDALQHAQLLRELIGRELGAK